MDAKDVRAASAIFTPKQVAELAEMPLSTVYSWMRPTTTRQALIHRVEPLKRGWPSIPLIGAAEAMVLRPLRHDLHMPMPEIAAAVAYIRERGGNYALANPSLLHDGILALWQDPTGGLARLRDGQGVLPILTEQLRPFRLAPDGFVEALVLKEIPETEIDPRFSAGRPFFTKTGVPVFAVAGMLAAGEPASVVAREYGVALRLVHAVEQADPSWLSQVA